MDAIRWVAFRDRQVLISRRCECAQVGHHAQVFRVKTTTLVMGDYPDRADRFALDVEGNQEPFIEKGLDLAEVGKVAFRM